MAKASDLHNELGMLRADLRKTSESRRDATRMEQAPPKDNAPAAKALGGKVECEEQLRELGKMLSEHMESVEDFLKEHQLASTLAAFVLGVAVGRSMVRA